jgi:hypothetical protein
LEKKNNATHLTPDGIKNCIAQNLYAQKGQLPNNFLQKLPLKLMKA